MLIYLYLEYNMLLLCIVCVKFLHKTGELASKVSVERNASYTMPQDRELLQPFHADAGKYKPRRIRPQLFAKRLTRHRSRPLTHCSIRNSCNRLAFDSDTYSQPHKVQCPVTMGIHLFDVMMCSQYQLFIYCLLRRVCRSYVCVRVTYSVLYFSSVVVCFCMASGCLLCFRVGHEWIV